MTSYSILVVAISCIWLVWIRIEACQYQFPCILNNTNGNITSPGYPVSYPDNVNISWMINVPHGFTIRLTFDAFALEDSRDCGYDYLAIYDGASTTGSPLIGKYCGTIKPPDQFSTEGQLLVVFESDRSHYKTGFNISYESIRKVNKCSSAQTSMENLNIILNKSPRSLQTDVSKSTRNIQCTWKIRAPKGHGIKVIFTSLRILSNVTCSVNNVLLYSGYYVQTSNIIQKMCGNNVNISSPIVKYTPESTAIIHLNAGWVSSWNAQSFVATYEFVKKDLGICSLFNNVYENDNIELSDSRGNFTVNKTWPDMQCRWRISAPKKHQIKLTFIDFKLTNDCQKAYVQIFDGRNINRGKFCGPDKPWVIFSTSGFLLVKLVVSGISKVLRFTGAYEAVTSAIGKCSTINSREMNTNIRLNSTDGIIMTPNFPSPYPPDFNCIWVITVPVQYRIKLNFTFFQFEGHSCRYDYLMVRDGGKSSSPSRVGKLCGSGSLPNDVYSSTNQLWVMFVSDHNEQKGGFLVTYSTVLPEPSKCTLANTEQENKNIQIRSTSGFLTSPNYPKPSPAIKCTWYITVPRPSRLLVYFYDVSLASWCSDVYFALHDGNCTCSKSLGSFCGDDVPMSIYTSGNALTVVFESSTSSHRGFNLSFHVPKLGPGICSVSNPNKVNSNLYLNKTNGQVTSPDYPYPYVPGTQCTWFATAPRGYHVQLSIKKIDLPLPCTKTYLEVRDGSGMGSPLKAKFCRTESKRVYSSGQNLVLKFVSSKSAAKSNIHPGKFVANYRMIKAGECSKEFDESWNTNLNIVNSLYGVVKSPGYPQKYPINMKCIWKITVPNNFRLKLTITSLSFGSSCLDSYLEVKDGLSSYSNSLGKFCGKMSRTEVMSSGKYMLLHFESGHSYERGFEAFFAAVHTEKLSSPSPFVKVLVIVLVVLAAFVVLTFSSLFVYWLLKKRWHPHRRPSPPELHDLTALPSLPPPSLDDIPDCLIAEDRPPSYVDATTNEPEVTQVELSERQQPVNQQVESLATNDQQGIERGLDNPAFNDASPPSYDSLYGADQ